jgi:general secretion pathway protein J
MRRLNRKSGFTLMELLLALSILSIILVVILGGLRISVRAWEKGENMLSVQQRSRTILDRLDRQLSSAALLMSAKEDLPLVAFAGTSSSLEFTSSLPLVSKMQFAPVHVKYVIETETGGKKRLLLYERNIEVEDYLSERQLQLEAEAVVFVEGLEDLRFEYLAGGGNGPDLRWTPTWQPEELTDLPRAVRITYNDGHRVQVIAGINLRDRFEEET